LSRRLSAAPGSESSFDINSAHRSEIKQQLIGHRRVQARAAAAKTIRLHIENHAGGGGNLGTALAARATPDGYTILVASSSFMINPGLYAKNPPRSLQMDEADPRGQHQAGMTDAP
jgi:Tripartite tricarboxylate transporter family receptor